MSIDRLAHWALASLVRPSVRVWKQTKQAVVHQPMNASMASLEAKAWPEL